MEALVLQKLQGALSAVRRERDQEFRNRNMAQEKLRSAQEASQSTRKSVQEEASKLDENNKKTQQAIQDIQKMDESIADLSRKVRNRVPWMSASIFFFSLSVLAPLTKTATCYCYFSSCRRFMIVL